MQAALSAFLNALKIEELRKRILFVLGVIVVFRLGAHITTPGVDAGRLASFFEQNQNNLFGLYDSFTGGAFAKATIFALGIMPYISASIVMQLMGSVVPSIQEMQKSGADGKAKLHQWTRYFTIVLAIFQSWGISTWLSNLRVNVDGLQGVPVLLDAFADGTGNIGFRLLTTLTLTTGTIFIMYLAEQITQRGIGNGASMLIFSGIVAQMPLTAVYEAEQFFAQNQSLAVEIIIIALIVGVVGFIVFVEGGQRRIPLQSPRRVVGRKVMGGQSSYLPFKVNTAGVIPVIFASSIMFVPAMLASFFPDMMIMQTFAMAFNPGHIAYSAIFAFLIIFFTYFYTAIQFNPSDIADNLKKSGGFIPGIRPGRKTAEFIDHILTRITLPGAIFLAFISVAPLHLKDALNMSFYIGGTSVLIVVGVSLDTLRQIEARLHEKNYDGFLKRGRIRGRTAQ